MCSVQVSTSKKKAVRFAVLSVGVGVMFIASFASPTHMVWLTLSRIRHQCSFREYRVLGV
jgi:hypothetical protein